MAIECEKIANHSSLKMKKRRTDQKNRFRCIRLSTYLHRQGLKWHNYDIIIQVANKAGWLWLRKMKINRDCNREIIRFEQILQKLLASELLIWDDDISNENQVCDISHTFMTCHVGNYNASFCSKLLPLQKTVCRMYMAFNL